MKTAKKKWTRTKPTVEGWYWIKYCHSLISNKKGVVVICPAKLSFQSELKILISAENVLWTTTAKSHRGFQTRKFDPKLNTKEYVDKSLHFGPKIEQP